MTTMYPESVPLLGAIKVTAVLAVADLEAISLATELTDPTAVELTCAFMSDGYTPTGTQGTTARRRRLCSKRNGQILLPAEHTFGGLMYSVGDPQNPETAITDLMVEGQKLYLVERVGPDAQTVAWALTQKYRVHYIELGEPIDTLDPTQDNAEAHMTQAAVYVNDGPVKGVVAA